MDYWILVGSFINGNWFYYFHGIVYKMLCCTYTIVKSKETTCQKDQWYTKKTYEYIKKNGEWDLKEILRFYVCFFYNSAIIILVHQFIHQEVEVVVEAVVQIVLVVHLVVKVVHVLVMVKEEDNNITHQKVQHTNNNILSLQIPVE